MIISKEEAVQFVADLLALTFSMVLDQEDTPVPPLDVTGAGNTPAPNS